MSQVDSSLSFFEGDNHGIISGKTEESPFHQCGKGSLVLKVFIRDFLPACFRVGRCRADCRCS